MTADPKSVERADVYRNTERLGTLTRTSTGSRFELDRAVFEAHEGQPGGPAVHLPWSRRVTETFGVNVHSFFAGLLPEGLRLKALVKTARTSEDDLFSLLIAAGPDCVGDLFVVPHRAKPPTLEAEPSEAIALEKSSFRELFEQSLGGGEAELPGVQAKLSPSVISFPLRATRGRKRWILKLDPPDTPGLVATEHFFMRMAASCRLDTASTQLVADRDGAPGLLVERFDRRWDAAAKRWLGVHQEDACQLLDRYPSEKYRLTTALVSQALDASVAPLAARLRLIQLVAFSYLIGNGDLHGKNVSLVAGAGGLVLSPAYDLLSTRPWGDRHLALKLEGRDDNVRRAHLVDFGARAGVPRAATDQLLDALITKAAPFRAQLSTLPLERRQRMMLDALMAKRLADLTTR